MPDLPVTDRSRTALLCACLIGAPLAETVEQALSPLTGGSTADDLAAIAASPDRFTASVLIGLVGTALLLPSLLGLARRGSDRSPTLALLATIAIVLSSLGFAGVRMAQGFEYALATGGMSLPEAAAQFDAGVSTPVGIAMTTAFLGGTLVGVILLAVALWRSRRVPVAAIILLLLFPVVDLAVPMRPGPIVSHLILLAAFTWFAVALLRTAPARRVRRGAPEVPARADA
jgi:hypothetical protein